MSGSVHWRCVDCGESRLVAPSTARKITRCRACSYAAARRLSGRLCESCKRPFQPRRSNTRFCCAACFKSSRAPGKRCCGHCGSVISAQHNYGKRKFCSRSCAAKGRASIPSRICPWCKNMFAPRRRSTRHCSIRCGLLAAGRERQKRKSVACATCGEIFHVALSNSKKTRCDSCVSQYRTRELSRCTECGAAILRIRSIAKKGHGKFCSRRCFVASYTPRYVVDGIQLTAREIAAVVGISASSMAKRLRDSNLKNGDEIPGNVLHAPSARHQHAPQSR